MKRYKTAAVLMFIHGGLMELGGIFMGVFAMMMGSSGDKIGKYVTFSLSFFNENFGMMIAMGAIFGIVRLIGAMGLYRHRMWGLVLSVINCVVTMVLMIFMIPAGIIDGILACSALILILVEYFGDQVITDE